MEFLFSYSNILKNAFPLKKEEQIQELMEAAGWGPDNSSTEVFSYRILFTEVGGDT